MFKALTHNQNVYPLQLSILMPVIVTALMIMLDLFLYNSRFDSKLNTFKTPARWVFYTVLLFCLMALSGTQKFTFIYFQF